MKQAVKKSDAGDGREPEGAGTMRRVLDVTERLMAEQGVGRVSIREITQAAGVNLAAVNYHFGSKEKLMQAVVERCIEESGEGRFEELEKLVERKKSGEKISVEDFLKALVSPMLAERKARGRHAMAAKLFSRLVLDSEALMKDVMMPAIKGQKKRLNALVQELFPQIPEEELLWRMSVVMGFLHLNLLYWEAGAMIEGKTVSQEERMRRLVEFCRGGFWPEGAEKKK